MTTTALAVAAPPRLPYTPHIEAEYGVSLSGWRALTDAVYPNAKTAEGVELALAYCKSRNLDIMKRPVHVVPVWSSALGRMVEGVWPAISELRTTAMRTQQYAGCAKTAFGPNVEMKFRNGQSFAFPEWAQKTVYRLVGGHRVAFEGPEVYWLETYATEKKDTDVPNSMWRKRPRGQIDKCAEAAALRTAFPEELGDTPTAEEMAGKTIDHPASERAEPPPRQVRTLHAGFEAPRDGAETEAPAPPSEAEAPPAQGPESTVEEPVDAEFEDLADAPLNAFDVIGWAVTLNRDLEGYSDVDVLRMDWAEHKDMLKTVNPSMFRELNKAVAARAQAIGEARAAAE